MAFRVGLRLSEYDEMTPYELNVYIEEFYHNKEIESKNDITIAYMTAYWHRVKKMPDLNKLLDRKAPVKKQQTDENMLATIRALNAALGGKEEIITNVDKSGE